MKKFFIAFAAVAMAFTSCSNEEIENASSKSDNLKFNFNITAESIDGNQTRALKTDWELEDEIFLVFKLNDCGYSTSKYMSLKWNGTEFVETLTSSDGDPLTIEDINNSPDKKFSAIFMGNGPKEIFSFSGMPDFYISNSYGLGYHSQLYMTAENVSYTVEDGVVNANINLKLANLNGYYQTQISVTGLPSSLLESDQWTLYGVDYNEYLYFCQDGFVSTSNDEDLYGTVAFSEPVKADSYNRIVGFIRSNDLVFCGVAKPAEEYTFILRRNSTGTRFKKTFNGKTLGDKHRAIKFAGPTNLDLGMGDTGADAGNGWVVD